MMRAMYLCVKHGTMQVKHNAMLLLALLNSVVKQLARRVSLMIDHSLWPTWKRGSV